MLRLNIHNIKHRYELPFHNMIKDVTITEVNDNKTILRGDNKDCHLFNLYLDTKYVICKYYNFWEVIMKEYEFNHEETQYFIKYMLTKYYNLVPGFDVNFELP